MNAAAITASVVVPITRLLARAAIPITNCDASGQQGLRPSSCGDCTGKAVPAKGRYGGAAARRAAVMVADPHAVLPVPADCGVRRILVVGDSMGIIPDDVMGRGLVAGMMDLRGGL